MGTITALPVINIRANADISNVIEQRTVISLYKEIEEKDTITAAHSKSVAGISVLLGKEIGLTGTELARLKNAALLHDIGKIFTDSAVLNKKETLTGPEWKQICAHTTKGARVTENFGLSKDVTDAVRHHHEKVDGTGYPDGLCGDSIPLLTKIVAVADITDAMGSDRGYRKPLSQEEIIRELEKASGTHTDRTITSLMISLIKQGMVSFA